MSRKNRKATDSHPWNFSTVDLQDVAREHDRWLDFTTALDFLSVDVVRRAQNEATRGAYAQLQWLWEQLEPADPILATCVERRLGALKRIPWDIRKKEGLSDAEDLLAEAQLRTVQDFANAIENLDEGIEALAQASFRHYRHIQLLETEDGSLRLNLTENWNWARDGYAGEWQWNPAATYGLTRGLPLPVDRASIVTRICARPIDQPAMMLCLDRKNAKAQWLVYNGRYGTPPVFAIMPQGVDEGLRKEYIKFAMQCVSNAAGVLPAGADVKTVTPGNGGPDTFSRMIDLSTQELVLRATGGLMTMLTAPGAGTNTATGSAHQDAFDDLAASEAEQIANLLQEKLFAPVLEQWHPGQPHLVEFVMRRPDSDNAAGSVANIATLAQNGYRTPDEQVAELTGLQVRSSAEAQPPHGATSAALNSLRVRYAPTMLYPPARAAFERALNAKVTSGDEAPRTEAAGEPPLNEGELEALRFLGAGLNPEQVAADAAFMAEAMKEDLRLTNDDLRVEHSAAAPQEEEEVVANSCNQYEHDADCDGADDDPSSPDDYAEAEEDERREREMDASSMESAGYTPEEIERVTGIKISDEEEIVTNASCNQYQHATGCMRFAVLKKNKGGRGSSGNPKRLRIKSNTPLRAARLAKPQAQVDAVEKAHKKTAKHGGSVLGAATIGKSKLNVRAGSPGVKREEWKRGGGSRHQKAKHGSPPENTDDRDAAKAMVLGNAEKRGKGKALRLYKNIHAVTGKENKRKEMTNITAYKKK